MFFYIKNMFKYFFNFLFYNFCFQNFIFCFFAKLEKVKIKIKHVFKVKKHVVKIIIFYKHVVLIFIKIYFNKYKHSYYMFNIQMKTIKIAELFNGKSTD